MTEHRPAPLRGSAFPAGQRFGSGLRLSLVAALTCWASMLAWSGFSDRSAAYLMPLFLSAVALAVLGATLRWLRVPAVLVLAGQVVTAALLVPAYLVGTPVPTGLARAELGTTYREAWTSIQTYAAPVSALVPGIEPVLIPLGLLCLLLVDLLAVGLRRVPWAGIVLLAMYSAPVSLLGGGVSWWMFVLSAAGFLLLLHLDEEEHLVRWGRTLGHSADAQGFGVRTGDLATRALATGAAATGLALLLPLAVPTLHLSVFDNGFGPGDGNVTIDNPMTDLQRDLRLGADLPLAQVTTDDPDPSYLRIAVLSWFTDNEWRAGDREIPGSQVAQGDLPMPDGLPAAVGDRTHDYTMRLTDQFQTRWLPAYPDVRWISAAGDWRYDLRTMDFLAATDATVSKDLRYSMTSVRRDPSTAELMRAPAAVGAVDAIFTDLPADLPRMVRNLATEVTRGRSSKFEQAVALQQWFRVDGGFRYDLRRAPTGNGSDALVAFLTPGDGGRVGYCEQFASAMAVMARTLNIPARVAVGFLNPDPIGDQTYEFSTRDLHAWPELYFPGSGWVRFEPTPSRRASDVPAYTDITLTEPEQTPSAPTSQATPGAEEPTRGASITAEPSTDTGAESAESASSAVPWGRVLLVLAGLAVAGGLLLVPLLIRRLRRARRWREAGGPETAWAELRDTAVDLGESWPDGLSPRAIGLWLGARLGDPSAARVERPARGRGSAPEAGAALDRLVLAVEEDRYARPADRSWPELRRDLETVVAALVAGASRAAVRRATWWPRSALRRTPRAGAAPTSGSAAARDDSVDRVG